MENKKLDSFKYFLKKNWLLFSCFFLVTFFFCWQNYWQRGWDFSAYVLNGKYFFHSGEYFEVYRAPLTPFLLGIFWFFGEVGNYLYIISVSIIFLISIILFSDFLYEEYFKKHKIKKEEVRLLFYLLILNPFILVYSLIEGTELLSLSFFMLFLMAFLSKKTSGHFLAFAFLTRYNFMLFLLFLFFSRSVKRIFKNLLSFFVVIFPWLFFNYLKYGNWFMSILDSYYLNIYRRLELAQSFSFFSLIKISNFYILFLLLGIFYFIFELIKTKKITKFKYEFFFVLIFLIFLFDIIKTSFKIERYLFNISLPFAFFSLIGIIKTKKEYLKNFLFFFTICVFLISLIYLTKHSFNERNLNYLYKEAAEKIIDLPDLKDCEILSHHWVPLAYYLKNVRSQYLNLNDTISENKISVIFLEYPTQDDLFKITEVEGLPKIYKNKNFAIIGKKDNCTKKEKIDYPLQKEPCKFISSLIKDYLLSEKIEKICLSFNKV